MFLIKVNSISITTKNPKSKPIKSEILLTSKKFKTLAKLWRIDPF